MYSEETLKTLSHPISKPSKNSGVHPVRTTRNTYLTLLIVGAILATSSIGMFLIPRVAGAFWPFSTTLAATDGAGSPMVHDASIDLLEAAKNANPNPSTDENVLAYTEGSALIPSAGPDGTVSDTQTAQGNGSISLYTVKPGDSLSEIADTYNVSVNTILWANDITKASLVKPGTTLVILPVSGIQHTVLKGETLSTLANKYGADASDIAAYNGFGSDDALTIGSDIIIPGGELTGSTPQKTSGTTSTTKKTVVATKTTKSVVENATASLAKLKTTTSAVISHSSTGNPYKGGSGAELDGYYTNPLPGALLTQSIHGWNGVDLGAHAGTSIHAAAEGQVIIAKTGGYNGGYGNYVVISHDNGTQTLYAHMTSVMTSVGDSVSAGEVIGTVGTTGDATGPHLHFEVRGARNPFADCTEMKVCSPE